MGSLHNELRGSKRLLPGIKAILGDRDADSGVERYSETLQPIVDPWGQPDFAFPAGRRLGWATALRAALVAERSICALVVPAARAPNTIATAWIHSMDGPAASALICMIGEAALLPGPTIAATRMGRDTRLPLIAGGRLSVELQTQDAAIAAIVPRVQVHEILTSHFPSRSPIGPFVITPGFGVAVFPNADNEAMRVNFQWVEREALAGELG